MQTQEQIQLINDTINKTKEAAMKNFFASFIQLGLLLILIIIDGMIIF